MRRDSASAAHRSCELNEERDNQSGDDDEHQLAHSRGRSPITLSTSRQPIPPANVCVGRRKGHSKIRHRNASWMLWDMLWRGSLHHRMTTTGRTRATAANTVQNKSEFTFPRIPAIVSHDPEHRNDAFDCHTAHPVSVGSDLESGCSQVH
jgi:hypothetical protein